jgi:hypothetical protein
VNLTITFNRQVGFTAEEVREVVSELMLTPKLETRKSATSKTLP